MSAGRTLVLLRDEGGPVLAAAAWVAPADALPQLEALWAAAPALLACGERPRRVELTALTGTGSAAQCLFWTVGDAGVVLAMLARKVARVRGGVAL